MPLARAHAGRGFGRERIGERDLAAGVIERFRDAGVPLAAAGREGVDDRVAQQPVVDGFCNSANAARTAGKREHGVAVGRRQSQTPRVDRLEKVADARGQRGVRGCDVVRNARKRRPKQRGQVRLRARSAPANRARDKGSKIGGVGEHRVRSYRFCQAPLHAACNG